MLDINLSNVSEIIKKKMVLIVAMLDINLEDQSQQLLHLRINCSYVRYKHINEASLANQEVVLITTMLDINKKRLQKLVKDSGVLIITMLDINSVAIDGGIYRMSINCNYVGYKQD